MRYITCITKGSAKTVKVYEGDNHIEVFNMIKIDNPHGGRLRYIRNMDLGMKDRYEKFLNSTYAKI